MDWLQKLSVAGILQDSDDEERPLSADSNQRIRVYAKCVKKSLQANLLPVPKTRSVPAIAPASVPGPVARFVPGGVHTPSPTFKPRKGRGAYVPASLIFEEFARRAAEQQAAERAREELRKYPTIVLSSNEDLTEDEPELAQTVTAANLPYRQSHTVAGTYSQTVPGATGEEAADTDAKLLRIELLLIEHNYAWVQYAEEELHRLNIEERQWQVKLAEETSKKVAAERESAELIQRYNQLKSQIVEMSKSKLR